MALFPERLKALRNNFGLSQQKLADVIGNISKSSINMYERGAREPSFETMEAFADFFNVDLDYLYGKSDIPNRSAVLTQPVNNASLALSPHEHELVLAYRQHPEMQAAVDTLLHLSSEMIKAKNA